jgi:hypothetical protein
MIIIGGVTYIFEMWSKPAPEDGNIGVRKDSGGLKDGQPYKLHWSNNNLVITLSVSGANKILAPIRMSRAQFLTGKIS